MGKALRIYMGKGNSKQIFFKV